MKTGKKNFGPVIDINKSMGEKIKERRAERKESLIKSNAISNLFTSAALRAQVTNLRRHCQGCCSNLALKEPFVNNLP